MRNLRNPDHAIHMAAIRYFQAVPNMSAYKNLGSLTFDPECSAQAQLALRAFYHDGIINFLAPASGKVGGATGALSDAVAKHNKQLEEVMGHLPGGPKDKVETALARLESGDGAQRLRAVIELGLHKDARASSALLAACRDADDDVARAAGVALKACGAEKHREALIPLLDHDRPAVRIAAAFALAGPEEALKKRLDVETDPAVKAVLRWAVD